MAEVAVLLSVPMIVSTCTSKRCRSHSPPSLSQVFFKRDGETINVIPYIQPTAGGEGGTSTAGKGSRPPVTRISDDTALRGSRPLLHPGGRPAQLHPGAPPHGDAPWAPRVSPAPATAPRRWMPTSYPLYYYQHTHIPFRNGTTEVQALLTWRLNPQLDDQALFSCEVKHPALSVPMQAAVTLGECHACLTCPVRAGLWATSSLL